MSDSLDDYDFVPSSSSNLASLFEISSGSLESSSLIYTAPKQPKVLPPTEPKSEPPKAESSVICACVVQVWKLVDYKYVAIGKHGLAIIGSAVQNTYELILYKEKRNVIVRIKMCDSFEVSLKKDNFASFYDSLNEHWLIKFSNEKDSRTMVEHMSKLGGKMLTAIDKIDESVKQPDVKPAEDISEPVDNSDNKAKADILSRIARMGQAILPNKSTELDMTEYEDEIDNNTTPVSMVEQSVISPPATVTNIVQVPRHSQNIPNSVLMTPTYDPMNIYVAENRAHNTEVRINLSQISEKLNHVLKLVDHTQPVSENSDALRSKVKVLNLKIENLSREIKTCQEENTKLKLQIREQQSDTELKRLQDEDTTTRINFEEEINRYKSTLSNMTEIIDKQIAEIDLLRMQLESHHNDTKLEDEISDLNDKISDLKMKLSKYEEQETATKLNEQVHEEKMANFSSVLKQLMNGMYGGIIENFNEDKDYSASEINGIIAQNIKSTTIKIIQNFQQISKNDSDT